ncbi:MAG TPA: discoidin domain-containing protein [Capsulimonadaceae bacterium]|jgi:alpha-L-fucosidase
MMKPNHVTILAVSVLAIVIAAGCSNRSIAVADEGAPQAYGAVPSPQQLAWQKLEMVAFVHFNMNTFTDREWGLGTEDTKTFNPTAVDCNQWVTALKAGGFKEIVLTAKHHDGFCLWPSAYTEHSVKNSPWKNGQGDVVNEFTDACHRENVKVGLYLSPWDRNSPYYGDSPKYNDYYLKQLTELLTHYGDISEIWFDGACGEGPNGKRQVYDWKSIFAVSAKYAPNAVMFQGDVENSRAVRWPGNEAGYVSVTNWNRSDANRDVARWYPAECDTSIRPGWYYHADQDRHVKSVEELLGVYYGSVGRGGVMMLNVPPDRRGQFNDTDVRRLAEFRQALSEIFARDLASGKVVSATNTRGSRFSPANLTGSDYDRYWACDDSTRQVSFTVDLGAPTVFNNIVLQEYIPLGQRIARFSVDALIDAKWQQVGKGTTIGYKRILWIPRLTATKVRVNILEAEASPVLTKFALYNGPRDAAVTPISLIAQKSATASNVHSNQTEFGADKAVDGDMETRWATDDGTSNCWLQVDAGEAVTVGKVHIAEFAPRIQQFQIEYKAQQSDDWKIAMAGNTAGQNYTKSFPAVTARWVRLHILKASDAPTIWEFQVYAPDAIKKPRTASLIEMKPITASNIHTNDPNLGPDMAVDGDMATRWATDDGTSECWLQSDAGSVVSVAKVHIAEFDPRITKFRIEYKIKESDDWKVALVGESAGLDYSKEFTPVQARYIRLHILTASSAPTIWEFQVFAP